VPHSGCATQFVYDSKAELMPVSNLLEKVRRAPHLSE